MDLPFRGASFEGQSVHLKRIADFTAGDKAAVLLGSELFPAALFTELPDVRGVTRIDPSQSFVASGAEVEVVQLERCEVMHNPPYGLAAIFLNQLHDLSGGRSGLKEAGEQLVPQ